MVDLPDTMVDPTDTMVDPTDTMVDLPDTMVDLPDTMVELLDTVVDLPDAMVDLPCTMILGSLFIFVLSCSFLVYCLIWLDMEGNLTIMINRDQSKLNKINQNQTRAN